MEGGHYRGRFAPTPSGPLHFGSLVAAMGSFLDARQHAGAWLLRMEDVDLPRVVPGAADQILRALDAFGFEWDGAVVWQSRRRDVYADAFATLRRDGWLYPCLCSRRQIAAEARRGVDGPVYAGTCRGRQATGSPAAWRFRVASGRLMFVDLQQGRVSCDLAGECGDFVLRRADGIYTYQLAVVVDDAAQGITHVVRGADLLTSTPRQVALQQALEFPTPAYRHLPVVLDAGGDKLSKQTLATPLDVAAPLPALLAAAGFLRMPVPVGAVGKEIGTVSEFWQWARASWPLSGRPAIRANRPPGMGRSGTSAPIRGVPPDAGSMGGGAVH